MVIDKRLHFLVAGVMAQHVRLAALFTNDVAVVAEIVANARNQFIDGDLVVGRDVDLHSVERSDNFNGVYFVLGGLVGVLEKDYQNKWGMSSTQRFFKDLYNKFVIPELNEKISSFG